MGTRDYRERNRFCEVCIASCSRCHHIQPQVACMCNLKACTDVHVTVLLVQERLLGQQLRGLHAQRIRIDTAPPRLCHPQHLLCRIALGF